jgi:hypothetical protein
MPLSLEIYSALSPARIHELAYQHCGHHPCWIRLGYAGGIYSIEHYRICSYCRCIHPADLVSLLEAGNSRLIRARPGKHILETPNPIAGELVRMGSLPGAVFPKDQEPADLISKLLLAAAPGISPTISERLAEHFDRPCLEPAPAMIEQPFYSEHTTESQWAAIEAAVEGA